MDAPLTRIIEGKEYELVLVKKQRKPTVYTEKGLAAKAKHAANLMQIITRAKFLYFDKDYKSRMKWQEVVKMASDQLKNEKFI